MLLIREAAKKVIFFSIGSAIKALILSSLMAVGTSPSKKKFKKSSFLTAWSLPPPSP